MKITIRKSGGPMIQTSHRGLLHKKLGVPEGDKIPRSKLAIHPGDSPSTRKQKQFAINFGHKHSMGGMVGMYEGGGDINNPQSLNAQAGGLTQFQGPSHENGGIPLDNDNDGQPNYEVEGGETQRGSYVHSATLGYNKFGFPTTDPKAVVKTFATAAKSIENKYKDRPDPISQTTKDILFKKLQNDNELSRVASQPPILPFSLPMMGDAPSQQADTTTGSSTGGMRKGGYIPKYWAGATVPDPTDPGTYDGTDINSIDTGSVSGGYNGTPVMNPSDYLSTTPGGNTLGVNMKDSSMSSYDPEGDTIQANPYKQSMTSGDKLQLAGMLPATAYDVAMGLKKPQKTQNIANPYANRVANLMANRTINNQPIIDELNLNRNNALQNLDNTTNSDYVRRSGAASLFANTAQALAKAKLSGMEANNGYRMEEANTDNNLGEQAQREGVRVQDQDLNNLRLKQNYFGAGMANLGQGLTTTGKAMNTTQLNTITMTDLNNLARNYGVDPKSYLEYLKSSNPNIQIIAQ